MIYPHQGDASDAIFSYFLTDFSKVLDSLKMGNIFLNWGSYAHLHLQPVLPNLTTYLNLIFLMFLTSNSELIPSLWLSWLVLGVFVSSIYIIKIPSPIIPSKKYCRRPRPNWKWSKRWRCRKFHYWLVRCCRRQTRHHDPRLDGSFSPSPQCTTHRN